MFDMHTATDIWADTLLQRTSHIVRLIVFDASYMVPCHQIQVQMHAQDAELHALHGVWTPWALVHSLC